MVDYPVSGPLPGLPQATGAKTAATATNFDAETPTPCTIVGISVYDDGEVLNGTLVQVSLLNEDSIAVFHFPAGIAGGDTVYSWNGDIPAGKNYIIRVTLTGATASTPSVRVMWRPRGQA